MFNLAEFRTRLRCYAYPSYKQVWSSFDKKVELLYPGQHFLHCKSMGKYFVAQRPVTLNWKIRYGPNLFEF